MGLSSEKSFALENLSHKMALLWNTVKKGVIINLLKKVVIEYFNSIG